MSHLDKDTKKILIGAAIGGVVGLTATLLIAGRCGHKKGSSMCSIGKVVAQLGEVIESTKEGKSFIKKAEREVESHENVILSVIDLAAAGIDLWKKFKKAG